MSGFWVLLGKELREQVRTHKFLIVAGVFLLLGLGTPLLLRYLPTLLVLSGEEIVGVELPTFTASDVFRSYAQGFAEMGVLVAVLIGMGAIAREREQGSMEMTLSKPVGRWAFILAKLAALSITFLVGFFLSALSCYGYTVLLFEGANASGFLAMNLLLWLFLMVVTSVTLLSSSLFRNQLAAGGLALGLLIAQALLSLIPQLNPYLPNALVRWGEDLVSGPGAGAWPALGVNFAIIALCLLLSWRVLKNKD